MKLLHSIHQYDILTFQWCMQCRFQALATQLSYGLSRTGDGHLYILLAFILPFLAPASGMNFVKIALVAFAIERPLYFILKNTLKRNRPAAALQGFSSFVTPSDKFSFPSGHTAAAFVMAGLGSHFYPGLSPLLYSWATLVGLSRIFLGVHFPTDVLVGSLLGSSVVYLCLSII